MEKQKQTKQSGFELVIPNPEYLNKVLNFLEQNKNKFVIRSEINNATHIHPIYVNMCLMTLYNKGLVEILVIGNNACFRFKQEGSKE
jgi:DNA-binding IscR family transcriptional regulator